MSESFRKISNGVDWLLVLFILPIMAAGIVTMKSFIPVESAGDFSSKQMIWVAISLIVFYIFSFINVQCVICRLICDKAFATNYNEDV